MATRERGVVGARHVGRAIAVGPRRLADAEDLRAARLLRRRGVQAGERLRAWPAASACPGRTGSARAAARPSAGPRRSPRASRVSSTSVTTRGPGVGRARGIDGLRDGRPRRRSDPSRRCASCCSSRRPGSRAIRRPGGPRAPWPSTGPVGRAGRAVVRALVAAAATACGAGQEDQQQRGGPRRARSLDRGYRAPRPESAWTDGRPASVRTYVYSAALALPNPRRETGGRGNRVVGANRDVNRRGAQALSAPARQLTPQADERELWRCPCGPSAHSSMTMLCVLAPAAAAAADTPPLTGGATFVAEPAPPAGGRRPGAGPASEVPGSVPSCSRTAPPRAGRRAGPGQAGDLGGELAARQAVQVRRRPRPRCATRATTARAPSRSRWPPPACWRRRWTRARSCRWGAAGTGDWITVYTNPGHAYVVIAGLRLDTSAAGVSRVGRTAASARESGPRWRPVLRSPRGYVRRHPVSF